MLEVLAAYVSAVGGHGGAASLQVASGRIRSRIGAAGESSSFYPFGAIFRGIIQRDSDVEPFILMADSLP